MPAGLKGCSMTKKSLIIGLVLMFASLIFAFCGIWLTTMEEQSNLSGKLLFEHTADQGADFDRAVITNADTTATIELKDGFWRIREAHGYYANFALANALFMNMNQSRYFIEVDLKQQSLSEFKLLLPGEGEAAATGTLIQTFAQDKLLDEIVVGKNTADNLYTYVRKKNDNRVWLVNNDFTLPQKLYSWFQQPLLNYAPEQIRTISAEIDDKDIEYTRLTPREPFTNQRGEQATLTLFADVFSFLTFQEVIPENEFKETDFPLRTDLEITLFNGLVTDISLFSNSEQKTFWAQIKISTNRLPTLGVNDYIKNNSFYYDGWLFKLAPETGYILFNTLAKKEQ